MNAFGYNTTNPDPRMNLTYYTKNVEINGKK